MSFDCLDKQWSTSHNQFCLPGFDEAGHEDEDGNDDDDDADPNLYHQEAEAEAVMRACVLANQVQFPPATFIIIIIIILIIIIMTITRLDVRCTCLV